MINFDIRHKVCVITGGAGLLAGEFARSILQAGGKVCLLDIDPRALDKKVKGLARKFPGRCLGIVCDITSEEDLRQARAAVLKKFKRIDVLINNAANNPKVENKGAENFSRLENFRLAQWQKDTDVGLTGAFLCAKVFGSWMADRHQGVIINMASDLGVIAPDQRIYRRPGRRESAQPVKPVTYSIVKHGIIGLTKYLATYWAEQGVRVNTLSPGGVYNGQPKEFLNKLTQLIPLRRMARKDEYNAAILFLISDAASYMTGANLVMDGGRTVW